MFTKRALLIGSISAVIAETVKATPASPKPILYWFYTSALDGIRYAPVSTETFDVQSLDIPCHGADLRSGEPDGLKGWRYRVDTGQDLFGEFIARVRAHLDPSREAFVGGVSRGAFCALMVASADKRFNRVVAISPVTDLLMLSEFEGCTKPVPTLNPADLKSTSIFMSIVGQDSRVGTHPAVKLIEGINRESGPESDIELIIEPGDRHTFTSIDAENASHWMSNRVTRSRSGVEMPIP